ncbi:LYR motif-containing protein bcn92 isoform X1 [Rhipicephalus microplus]|uniref:LYR motif-containing protein bcn92 isoform X1 n=1 Tax=Rhipicephalus microplus TaxID=6941 RepID=UPI003F6B022F
MAASRRQVLRLYKELMRECGQFKSYIYRGLIYPSYSILPGLSWSLLVPHQLLHAVLKIKLFKCTWRAGQRARDMKRNQASFAGGRAPRSSVRRSTRRGGGVAEQQRSLASRTGSAGWIDLHRGGGGTRPPHWPTEKTPDPRGGCPGD